MRAVTFGEILWDDFGDRQVIGGAPLNLAAHMNRVGVPTGIITAVGEDAFGDSALEVMSDLCVNDRFVKHSAHPTGVCRVSGSDAGFPVYDLVQDVAYDHIVVDDADLAELGKVSLFCFGTLAQRSPTSLETIEKILNAVKFEKVFCDLNIRQKFYDRHSVALCLRWADILKISREELPVLKELGFCEYTDTESICAHIAERYSVDLLLITLDKDGALVYDRLGNRFLHSMVPQSKPVSTVGAGDSFSAAFLAHYLHGDDLETCLECAVKLSDYVVTQLGAVPDYPCELIEEICIK